MNSKLNKVNKPNKLVSRFLINGTVKARTCRHCGHHEIGIVTGTGEYIPLKPGMKIAVLEEEKKKHRKKYG